MLSEQFLPLLVEFKVQQGVTVLLVLKQNMGEERPRESPPDIEVLNYNNVQ